MPKLQILIPHWQETPEMMTPMLDSLALQQGVSFAEDFGVIICYDGEEASDLPEEEWCKKYPYPIDFIKHKHAGLSATRNDLLDYAWADWIMFCDADDMFCSSLAVYIILQEMPKGHDVMIDMFMEEVWKKKEKRFVYVEHECDSTFIHGKVYRRQYLVDHDIKFSTELVVCEDSQFNQIAMNFTLNVWYCNFPYYLWKWRDDSTVRKDGDAFYLLGFPDFIKGNSITVERLFKAGLDDAANYQAWSLMVEAYYTMNDKKWIPKKYLKARLAVGKAFKDWLTKWDGIWQNMDAQFISLISNETKYSALKDIPNGYKIILKWCEDMANAK